MYQGSTDRNQLVPEQYGPEQDQQNLDILDRGRTGTILVIYDQLGPARPARTRTEKILQIPDQLGPGPNKLKIGPTWTETINFQRSWTYADQDYQN